jgi:hypothetical protein
MKPRILIAVYGDHQQAIVSELLAFNIRVPTDVMEAIAGSEQRGRRFDVLVLDAGMPECYDAAEYTQDLGWQAKMSCVSAVDDLSLRLKACEIRCDAFFVLPDELQQIKPLVAALMEVDHVNARTIARHRADTIK